MVQLSAPSEARLGYNDFYVKVGVNMDRILVNSSNLISVGYDHEAQVLEVEFQSGSVYRYLQVPPELYQDLMTAGSKGRYFHDHIMNQYDFAEV